MNKKGNLLMIVMVVIVFINFTLLYLAMVKKDDYMGPEQIGDRQFNVWIANARAQQALYYIEHSAELAQNQAVYEYAKKGSGCHEYLGYAVLNKGDTICKDSGFEQVFNDELNKFLLRYPSVYLPVNNYAITETEGKLLGSARQDIVVDITDFDVSSAGSSQAPAKSFLYAWPSSHDDMLVTSCYGKRNIDYGSKDHKGIDIRGNLGDPVFAIADGTVAVAKMKDWGEVKMEHSEIISSRILHASSILVKEGDKVRKGQIIATVGNTAPESSPVPVHLHFEYHLSGVQQDPIEVLFGIDEFGLKFSPSSNCVYNADNYAYKDLILNNIFGQ